MNADEPKPGLRDRKRAETRARIESAAVALVLSDGLDAATVDAISEHADISPRTFFNYFESKDAAVLGVRPHEADEDAIAAEFAAADDLDPVVAVVGLVMASMGIAESMEAGLHGQRLEIIRRHPEVLTGQFAQLHARKDRLVEHTSQILARHAAGRSDATDADADPDAPARGDIVLALCSSAVRSAVLDWAQHGTSNPDSNPGSNPGSTTDERLGADDVAAIEQRAVVLVRTTLERIS